jgi:plasmid stabilization system protein ParE
MKQLVVFHELAEDELNEAAEYYESQIRGLGAAFLTEVQHSINFIQSNPESSPRILNVVRKRILRRFPYNILYSVTESAIQILAVAHQKRRPFFWRARK